VPSPISRQPARRPLQRGCHTPASVRELAVDMSHAAEDVRHEFERNDFSDQADELETLADKEDEENEEDEEAAS
jgi:hypothetical protein